MICLGDFPAYIPVVQVEHAPPEPSFDHSDRPGIASYSAHSWMSSLNSTNVLPISLLFCCLGWAVATPTGHSFKHCHCNDMNWWYTWMCRPLQGLMTVKVCDVIGCINFDELVVILTYYPSMACYCRQAPAGTNESSIVASKSSSKLFANFTVSLQVPLPESV